MTRKNYIKIAEMIKELTANEKNAYKAFIKEYDSYKKYFNKVIKPSVIVNGNRTPVPIIYGSPERWKGVLKDGYFRDKGGKLQVPLIMF